MSQSQHVAVYVHERGPPLDCLAGGEAVEEGKRAKWATRPALEAVLEEDVREPLPDCPQAREAVHGRADRHVAERSVCGSGARMGSDRTGFDARHDRPEKSGKRPNGTRHSSRARTADVGVGGRVPGVVQVRGGVGMR